MTTRHDHREQDRRTRITAAAITGLLAGLTRTIVAALLHHLTSGC
jgi:hypothetical protein